MQKPYLGMLSAEHESNGDPGCISHAKGDAGGASYGAYQFADNFGVPREFINWLAQKNEAFGNRLVNLSTGTPEFDAEWIAIAQEDTEKFEQLQYEFTKKKYYNGAVARVRDCCINMEKHSFALQNVLWSAAVQYDVFYCKELFEDAAVLLGYQNPSYLDDVQFDNQLIEAIYKVRASDEWTSGSPSLRPGLRNRFAEEGEEALKLLEDEKNGQAGA